jgi:hypothetical protein
MEEASVSWRDQDGKMGSIGWNMNERIITSAPLAAAGLSHGTQDIIEVSFLRSAGGVEADG